MADYHILQGNRDGNSFTVVFHVPIPDVNNEVGVNYRAAIIETLADGVASQVPFITETEQLRLNAAEIVETTWTFHTHPGEMLAQKRDRIDAAYMAAIPRVQAEWQHRLAYYGYSRDVTTAAVEVEPAVDATADAKAVVIVDDAADVEPIDDKWSSRLAKTYRRLVGR